MDGAARISTVLLFSTAYFMLRLKGTPKNLLRVAFAICDARRTAVRLRFSIATAAARDGFSRCPLLCSTEELFA
jgi:hypothetical protein